MSGTYQRYRDCRDSHVSHLGTVPRAWETKQLKRSVEGCVNGIWGSEATDGGDDIVVLRVADFDRPRLRIKPGAYTKRAVTQSERIRRLVRAGDLLLEKSGGGEKTLVGQVVIFDGDFDAVCSNFVAKMTPSSGHDSSYLNYSFSALYGGDVNLCSIKQNTGIQNLDSKAYLAELWAFPALEEQTQIAKFLDYETAKIDALIEKQQQLIALLKEKRQAVISHAVTKGLNPDAPMRDSGVEWLGKVPAHWNIQKTAWHFGAEKGRNAAMLSKEYCGGHQGPYPVYSGQTAAGGVMGRIDTFEFDVGDEGVLFSTTVGAKAMHVSHLFGKFSLSQNCLIMRPRSHRFALRFAYFAFQVLFGFERRLIPDHMQASFRMEDFYKYRVVQPPLQEQADIATHLDQRCGKFDSLVQKQEEAVNLLQERRTALISAAVTGKIDVRTWTAPTPTETPA